MHEKLLKKLEGEKRWMEIDLFKRHAVGERPDLLRAPLTNHAVKRHDDERALALFELLLLAIDDVHAEAFRKESVSVAEANAGARQRRHEEAVKAAQAQAAMELWRASPEYRDGTAHDRDTYESWKIKDPTLLVYKQRLLEIIVQRWRETNSEEEAEALFTAIVDASVRKDEGGNDLLKKAFRATKEHHAHRDRTMRGILLLIEKTPSMQYFGGVDAVPTMWKGLARQFERREIQALGAIMQHVPLSNLGVSSSRDLDADPLIQALARDAKAYRGLHDAMCDLRSALKLPAGQIHSFEPSYWSQPPRVDLKIGASKSWSATGEDVNDFHRIAHDLHDQVQAWLTARSASADEAVWRNCPRIALTIFKPVRYGDPELIREFTVG